MDVGAELQRAREAKGVSLEKLAATTRIRSGVLDGIERNDLAALPPRPYARGFIASYAREVGLDPDATVREYFAQFEPPPPAVESAAHAAMPPHPARRQKTIRPIVVVAVVAAASALVAILAFGRGAFRAGGPPVSAISVQAPAVGTSGRLGSSDSLPSTAQPTGPSSSGSSSAVRDVRPSGGTPEGELVVTLQTEAPCWISATADGVRHLYQNVAPGSSHTFRARRQLVLRVGDAGAVRWSVNGQPSALMGDRGEVRTVMLSPADAAERR
jgi:cytoskeletal protein RodZ